MAAKPIVKFMAVRGGAVHVITTKREDMKHSKCPQVKKGHTGPGWRGKSLSPEAALELKGCARCKTQEVAERERKARMTPAQKRAETIHKRDETLTKMAKPEPKQKKGKPAKAEPSRRRGPRGGDKSARMKSLVEEHAAFARKYGWDACVENNAPHEWAAVAKRGGETLRIIWTDGRVSFSRVLLASGVEVKLRNSANWLKHAEGKSGIKPNYAPKGNRGKKAARTERSDDGHEEVSALPFNLEEDDPEAIIESLAGMTITWRRVTDNRLDSATLPLQARNCRIKRHPKSGRLMISFFESQGQSEDGELLGGERTVFIDKIIRALR